MNKKFIVKFYMVNGDQFNLMYQAVSIEEVANFINEGLNMNFISDGELTFFVNSKNINGFEITEKEEVTA